MSALALLENPKARWFMRVDGWAKTANPDYKDEYAASDRPWRVIHTIWVRYNLKGHPTRWAHGQSEREGQNAQIAERGVEFSTVAVAKVYDPRLDEWVFRRLARENDQSAEWVFLKPTPTPAHFASLADAKRDWDRPARLGGHSRSYKEWALKQRVNYVWALTEEDES
jgi:hypothetical protein